MYWRQEKRKVRKTQINTGHIRPQQFKKFRNGREAGFSGQFHDVLFLKIVRRASRLESDEATPR